VNTEGNSSRRSGAEDKPSALRAGSAAEAWEDAVRLQRWATPDLTEFYALAGEVVRTLYALNDLAQVLGRQVGGYAQGRAVCDDTREVDPRPRLADAVAELAQLSHALVVAERAANGFWSAIGHIRVDPTSCAVDGDGGRR
jgi:hypothetical protein